MTNILYRVVRRWGVVDQVSGMLTSIIEYETPKVVTVHNVSIGQSVTSCSEHPGRACFN